MLIITAKDKYKAVNGWTSVHISAFQRSKARHKLSSANWCTQENQQNVIAATWNTINIMTVVPNPWVTFFQGQIFNLFHKYCLIFLTFLSSFLGLYVYFFYCWLIWQLFSWLIVWSIKKCVSESRRWCSQMSSFVHNQIYFANCHRGVKKPEHFHSQETGYREYRIFFLKKSIKPII